MKKTTRSIPPQRRVPPLVLLAVVIAGAIILLLLKNSDFDNKKTTLPANSPEQTANSAAPLSASQPPSSAAAPTSPPPAESLPPAPEPDTPQKISPCQDASANLHALFQHLEQQQYVKAYLQKEPAQVALNRIITKVLNAPPTNSNETSDLLTIIRNSSHLYRVLGRKDLSLIKDIITNEHNAIEQHFATLYAWSQMDKACRGASATGLELPLAQTYEYAVFFLNTLGGQSYLSRRDPAVRSLAKYYCVLILSQAARQSMNIHNIDLSYHLDSAINDIANSDFLENQNAYLATLKNIKSTLHHKPKP